LAESGTPQHPNNAKNPLLFFLFRFCSLTEGELGCEISVVRAGSASPLELPFRCLSKKLPFDDLLPMLLRGSLIVAPLNPVVVIEDWFLCCDCDDARDGTFRSPRLLSEPSPSSGDNISFSFPEPELSGTLSCLKSTIAVVATAVSDIANRHCIGFVSLT
jgi:hypothetical protein